MPRKSKKEPDASVPRRVTRRSVQQQDLEGACKPEASSSKVASSPTAKQSAKKAASPVTSPSPKGNTRGGRGRRKEPAQEEPLAAGDQLAADEEAAAAAAAEEPAASPEVKVTGRRGRRSRGSAAGTSSPQAGTPRTKRANDASVENEQNEKRVKLSETDEGEEKEVAGKEDEEPMEVDAKGKDDAATAGGATDCPKDGGEASVMETDEATTDVVVKPPAATDESASEPITEEATKCEAIVPTESAAAAAAAEPAADSAAAEPTNSLASEPVVSEVKEAVESAAVESAEPTQNASEEPVSSTAAALADQPAGSEAVQTGASADVSAAAEPSCENGVAVGAAGPATDSVPSKSSAAGGAVNVAASSPVKESGKTAVEEGDGYVMVSIGDVPPHGSPAVQSALPVASQPTDGGQAAPATTEAATVPPGECVFGAMLGRAQPSVPPADTPPANQPASAPTAPSSNGAFDGDVLLSRRFMASAPGAAPAPAAARQFTVASYNVLAECHALRDARSGEAYRWVSADRLLADVRHARLLAELTYLDADVVCLQEVGPHYFTATLQPAMSKLGYEGVMVKRSGDMYDEGEATFVRSSRFTLVHSRSLILADVAMADLESSGLAEPTRQCIRPVVRSSAVTLLSKLRCRQTDSVLAVANIHVSFERFQRPDLQCVEVSCAIRELVKFAGGNDAAHIICGDFNAVSTSPPYQLVRDGFIDALSKAKLQALPTVHVNDKIEPLSNLWGAAFQHTSSNLKSAYETVQACNPLTSTFPHDSVMRGVDYLWYASRQLDVLGVLQTPPADLIKGGIPNNIFPSDHLSVKAQFAFK